MAPGKAPFQPSVAKFGSLDSRAFISLLRQRQKTRLFTVFFFVGLFLSSFGEKVVFLVPVLFLAIPGGEKHADSPISRPVEDPPREFPTIRV